MLQLTNPIWLTAIAAISIPVIIHLWNIRPGKTLKVGSISLIEASSKKSSRSFNLMDILLLLLRCLFLTLLALLLTQPYWSSMVMPVKQKGWLLIPQKNIHQIYKRFQLRIDSLSKAGYELHYFNTGFAKIDTAQLKTLTDGSREAVNNWILLKELSQQVSPTLSVYLFTSNALTSVEGTKPQLALNLHIQTYNPADSTSKWVHNAAFTSSGNAVKIIESNSKVSGTTFSSLYIQPSDKGNSAYRFDIDNGKPKVRANSYATTGAFGVDTATLKIVIYTDKYSNDAEYLKAAIASVKQFTDKKIQVVKFTDAGKISDPQNWIFWLSDKSVPAQISTRSKFLFVYETGKPQNINTWIGDEKIALTKHIAGKTSEVIWPDGFGDAVVGLDADGKTYRCYTHFDPAWNDLVWNDAFPKMVLNLLIKPGMDNSIYDRRTVTDEQLKPVITEDKTIVTESKVLSKTDLHKAFWLALVLLFAAERWFAHRIKTETYG